MNNNFNYNLSERTLLMFAQGLCGYSVKEVSEALSEPIPKYLKKNKGFIGILLEKILGSNTTNNKSCVDFPSLGIELKSIPINELGYPLEDTCICTVPLTQNTGLMWENSYLYQKIKKILWIAVQGSKKILLQDRLFKKAFIWSPSKYETKIVKSDWEILMDKIVLGEFKKISSTDSNVLYIKNKHRNKFSRIKFTDELGNLQLIKPKAFYFKKRFTKILLKKY